MFFKNVWNFDFQNLFHTIYVYTEISESNVFDTIWLLFYSFFTSSCHENTLVLPEEQKIIFENQVSTTEFRHRDTALLTKIATVLGAWTPTFQCL